LFCFVQGDGDGLVSRRCARAQLVPGVAAPRFLSGIVGIKYLLPTLSNAGRNDVALQIAQTPTQPVR
jgi:hypothetical protein